MKDKILCVVPAILGFYCVLQGSLLFASDNFLVQCLGVGLFLWVPGCAYYTWRGRKAFSAKVVRSISVPVAGTLVETAN